MISKLGCKFRKNANVKGKEIEKNNRLNLKGILKVRKISQEDEENMN
jgi:hypothetical protein